MLFITLLLLLIAPGSVPSTRVIQETAPPPAQQSPTTQSPAEPVPQSQSEQPKERSKRPIPSTGKRKSNPPSEKPEQNTQAPDSKQTAPEPTVTKPEAPKTETVPANAPEKPENKTSPDWWIVWLTGALVIVGACQLIAMGVQTYWMVRTVRVAQDSADAANRTARNMQETAQRQLRAYVHPVTAVRTRDEAGVLVVRLEIKNAGQTPAYECSHYMVEAVHVGFPAPPEAFRNTHTPKGDSPIAPGESVDFFITATVLTPALEAQIASRKAAIYLFGEITYRDAFQTQRRVTKFRLMCVGDLIRTGRFAPCEEGNDAT